MSPLVTGINRIVTENGGPELTGLSMEIIDQSIKAKLFKETAVSYANPFFDTIRKNIAPISGVLERFVK